MTAPIAVRASYADFKLLKTRSVYQIILEAPIEQAEDFVTAFGLPMPGAERPVAVALLNPSSGPPIVTPEVPGDGEGADKPVVASPQAAGGHARAAALEPERRSEIARTAADTRWGKRDAPQRCPTAAPDRLVQYVAIACGDPKFRTWLKSYIGFANVVDDLDHQGAIAVVRQLLGVKSRAEISTNPVAREKAKDLMFEYDQAMGRATEDRS